MHLPAQQDRSTVSVDGAPKQHLIDGVLIRHATTQTDERGTVCEILNPAWGFQPDPIVYVYQFTIRPKMVKGWHVHHSHDDRIFISMGTLKVVLYDDRPDSPTYQMINEVYQNPDVFRLPVNNDYIPYHFEERIGW